MDNLLGNLDFMFKIIIVGNTNVGKTKILERYINNKFIEESKSTIGVDFCSKNVYMKNYRIKLQFWDTAG